MSYYQFRYQLIQLSNRFKRHIPVLFITLLLGVSAISLSKMVQKPVDYQSKAAVEAKEVAYLIYPPNVASYKGEVFTIAPKLLGPMDKRIASVIFSLRFNPGHLKLTEVNEGGLVNLSVLQKNTLEEANKDGVVDIFLGASDIEKAPTGAVNLPQLKFYLLTEDTSSINWGKPKLQIVFGSGEQAVVKADSSVSVNSRIPSNTTPASTRITVTSSPSAALSPIATVTSIIPTLTPVVVPTAIITPSNQVSMCLR